MRTEAFQGGSEETRFESFDAGVRGATVALIPILESSYIKSYLELVNAGSTEMTFYHNMLTLNPEDDFALTLRCCRSILKSIMQALSVLYIMSHER